MNYHQIFGALPLPNWVIYGSKFMSLILVCFVLVNMVMFSGMLNQIVKGYFNFEFDKYFTDLYLIELPRYISFVMLAFFVHSLVAKKFMGHVLTIAIWIVLFGINSFANVNYNMALYSYAPGYTISDLNGFGHFGSSLFWFRIYWLAFGAILTIVGLLFWQRGADTSRTARMQLVKSRLNTPTVGSIVILALIWLGAGGYIYYNVSVLNNYTTADENREASANYEKKFGKYSRIAQPKVVDVKVHADLVPEERMATISGKFLMVNKTDEVIDSLHIDWGGQGVFKLDVTNLRFLVQHPL